MTNFLIKDPGDRVPMKRKLREVYELKKSFKEQYEKHKDKDLRKGFNIMIDECDKRIDDYKK